MRKKVSQFRKKTERGPFGIFQDPFYRKTPDKMKAEPLRKIFCLKKVALCRNNEKKIKMSHNAEKLEGGTL